MWKAGTKDNTIIKKRKLTGFHAPPILERKEFVPMASTME